jgi:hypothetical protein
MLEKAKCYQQQSITLKNNVTGILIHITNKDPQLSMIKLK